MARCVHSCLHVIDCENDRNVDRLQVHGSFAVMAGRGRGAASFTFNIEALGIGRGSMPDARVGPSPLFPVSTQHTLALHNSTSRCTVRKHQRIFNDVSR